MFSVNDFYCDLNHDFFKNDNNSKDLSKKELEIFLQGCVPLVFHKNQLGQTLPISVQFYKSLNNNEIRKKFQELHFGISSILGNLPWVKISDILYNCLTLFYGKVHCFRNFDSDILLKSIFGIQDNSNLSNVPKLCSNLWQCLPIPQRKIIQESSLTFMPLVSTSSPSEFLDFYKNYTVDCLAQSSPPNLPTDNRQWLNHLETCWNAFCASATAIDEGVDLEWLVDKLTVFPIQQFFNIPTEEFADRLLLRMHLNESADELRDYLSTVFGFKFIEEIDEIIININSLIKNTSEFFKPFLDQIAKEQFTESLKETQVKKPFSMTHVEPTTNGNYKSESRFEQFLNTIPAIQSDKERFRWFLQILSEIHDNFETDWDQIPYFIYDILVSNRSNDEVAEALTNMLGISLMEIIFKLIERRNEILSVFTAYRVTELFNTTADRISSFENTTNNSIKKEKPSIARQVVVQSAKEKQLLKELRREEKKCKKRNKDNETGDIDQETRLTSKKMEYEEACLEPILPTNKNIQIFEKISNRQNLTDPGEHIYQSETKRQYGTLLLAEGSVFKNLPLYKKVDIPAGKTTLTELLEESKLVKIDTLDPLGQKVFSHVERLNVIQSMVFDVAYNTNENLLICAPTGAGKTNIALLTVTRCLQSRVVGTVLQDKHFKIVYIAPMKALAAEMSAKFASQLKSVCVRVRELTGDMQLSRQEIEDTQIIVTTPEKWDVVTRKPDGDTALPRLVRLLIIDEVHLLNEERGHVIEAVVARTQRLVEKTQECCRIVGLSATLPNYRDVAQFLRVNLRTGLYFFDQRFRPVPLATTFIGAKENTTNVIDQACYDEVVNALRHGHQVMVFVHTRRGTTKTAEYLREQAQNKGTLSLFQPTDPGNASYLHAKRLMQNSRDHELRNLFEVGLAIHHAGMLRADRNHVEKFFVDGHIRVLVCTATLAWGVNLPAHTVIIKGTSVYTDGQYRDLDILDVQQIFGRAGRPQYDTSGHAIIITEGDKLDKYLRLMTNQCPIESNFVKHLVDNLNAEIVLGNVTTIDEAVTWLSYTYLFIRMKMNPLVYGIDYAEKAQDPDLIVRRQKMIDDCAKRLNQAHLIRYNSHSGDLISTDLGRIASHFYINYDTIQTFNERMMPIMTESEILDMITHSQEFDNVRVREEELDELYDLLEMCSLPVVDASSVTGKVNILLQMYLTRYKVQASSLTSDLNYTVQNVPRIARALFEIFLRSNNAIMAGRLLKFALMFDNQMWDYETPLRQFPVLQWEILHKVERQKLTINQIRDMEVKEIGNIIRNQSAGTQLKRCAESFPFVDIESKVMPITRHVLRIELDIKADFKWDAKFHGAQQSFWLWVEDPDHNNIYHYEYFSLMRRTHGEAKLFLTIPLLDPTPNQYLVRVISDTWLAAESYHTISFATIVLPSNLTKQTQLLNLRPLATTALQNRSYEALYPFNYFNPIQTQMFFTLYHTDHNILLGAPTGSGKTIIAEIAMLRLFTHQPNAKVVYVAPLKALVRERVDDWKRKFAKGLKFNIVELTGDASPDKYMLEKSHIIITTPEKWDIVSRSWENRSYVQLVGLLIMDEVHLLGEDRGPVLEAIVSRTNYIASKHNKSIRTMGLSTATANAYDLAGWLGVSEHGLYNFSPSVRPVPLEVHISGYPGKHYCPRMALMNKPTFQAIREHAPDSPSLVFVSSRRQTRITAMELINFMITENNTRQWLRLSEDEILDITENIRDETLKHTLEYGVGVHHAGLLEKDRLAVESLFLNQKILVLVATATLAWGVNFPAHLVVVKGTEYYDAKTKRYIDMPITDVLQMMGRAGRPQFDETGVAVVLVHDIKKGFYKKFLYEPFPVESHMLEALPNHLYAEIATGTITNKKNACDYITWTYLYRRLLNNPTYYGLYSTEDQDILDYVNGLIDSTINLLAEHNCCISEDDGANLQPTIPSKVGANFYLDYRTVKLFSDRLDPDLKIVDLMQLLCNTFEFSEVPVRHNEDLMNACLARDCRYVVSDNLDSPHVKTWLLLQSHLSRLPMPCADYSIDLKLVLDNIMRILHAALEYAATYGFLETCVRLSYIGQMFVQAQWIDKSPFEQVPTDSAIELEQIAGLPFCGFVVQTKNDFEGVKAKLIGEGVDCSHEIVNYIYKLPVLSIWFQMKDSLSKEVWVLNDGNTTTTWDVHADRTYCLHVDVQLIGEAHKKVSAPFYPRAKQDGWVFLLGTTHSDGCPVTVRKLTLNKSNKTKVVLTFRTPQYTGIIPYRLLVLSDSYIGLDQDFNFMLNVMPNVVT